MTSGYAIFFGLRLWLSVCLAIYVAFCLELDNAYWAGAAATVVCRPNLGASLSSGSFRILGTVVGGAAVVFLALCFPQSRAGFLLGFAVWTAACGFFATLPRGCAALAPIQAGYAAAIIARDLVGATGGTSSQVFILAVTRSSELCIGIICATVVLAGTDLGNARRRLAAQITALSLEITEQIARSFSLYGGLAAIRPVRHSFVRRVVALVPIIDQAIREESERRYHLRGLYGAVDSLFQALSGWRRVANCLERLPPLQGKSEAAVIRDTFPQAFFGASQQDDKSLAVVSQPALGPLCRETTRALMSKHAESPSLRLMIDGTAQAMLGISRALEGLELSADASQTGSRRRRVRFYLPDLLPATINATRALVAVIIMQFLWIATAWPNGATGVAFAAIGVVLLSPREDQAYSAAKSVLAGVCLAAVAAGITKFAVLPGLQTFFGFSVALGAFLVPIGALSSQPWCGVMFTTMTAYFIPHLAPGNQMTYDTTQFYNAAIAIATGIGAALVALVLLPPLPPAIRSRRLLMLSLRDLRRLLAGKLPEALIDWEGRANSRLSALPPQVEALQLARLMATHSVGSESIRLRRFARGLNFELEIETALDALAQGDCVAAAEQLAGIDRRLATEPVAPLELRIQMRARSSIFAISDALAQHASYFSGRTVR